jgi:predicted transcriptional regulator
MKTTGWPRGVKRKTADEIKSHKVSFATTSGTHKKLNQLAKKRKCTITQIMEEALENIFRKEDI